MHGKPGLLEIVYTGHSAGSLTSLLNCWQEKPHQHTNNGDHNKQLNECKSSITITYGHTGPPCVKGSEAARMNTCLLQRVKGIESTFNRDREVVSEEQSAYRREREGVAQVTQERVGDSTPSQQGLAIVPGQMRTTHLRDLRRQEVT